MIIPRHYAKFGRNLRTPPPISLIKVPREIQSIIIKKNIVSDAHELIWHFGK